jgi:hypothetical protein
MPDDGPQDNPPEWSAREQRTTPATAADPTERGEPPRDPDHQPGPPSRPSPDGPVFRLLVVPGTTPAKWMRTWTERTDVPVELIHTTVADQLRLLRDGHADAGLLRLASRPDDLSAIPLYTEATVVVVPQDHVLTAADEVTAADLVDETLLVPADDVLDWVDPPGEASLLPTPETTEDAVALVASGVGVLVAPQSLARLHHRKDLTYRTVTDAPTSTVHLAWPTDRTTDDVELFVGIVRGRTVNSSRGASTDADTRRSDAGPPRDGTARAGGRVESPRRSGSGGTPARRGGPQKGRRRPGGGRGRGR